MGVLEVTEEIQQGRTGNYSLNDGKLERSYTRTWKVKTDGNDGALMVLNAVSVRLGNNYSNGFEYDNNVICVSLDANCEEPTVWTVTANYHNVNPNYNNINPIDNKPKVSFEWMQYEEVVDVDVYGNPVVNSSGLCFDPPITRQLSLPILVIERNEAKYPAIALSMKDTVNKDKFLDADAHTVKLSNIQAHDEYDPTLGKYWQVTYEFQFDPNQFKKKIVDAGLMKLDASNADTGLSKIFIDGVEATSPIPLDGSGNPLVAPVTADDLTVLEFSIYPESDFSVFNFDTSIFS